MRPAAALRCRPLSDKLRPSLDAPRSLARCVAVAIRVVPGNYRLFFRFVQDVAHIDEGYMPHAEINVPGLILVGRSWVTPEGVEAVGVRLEQLADLLGCFLVDIGGGSFHRLPILRARMSQRELRGIRNQFS
jgi:hypothetical protein